MYDPTERQPPRGSGGASVVLLSLCALAGVAGAAVSLSMLDLVNQAEMGAELTLERWLAAWAGFVLQSLLAAGLYLLTGVFFLTWLFKTVAFARFVAPEANRVSPGWAWTLLVPIVGHILPAQMAHSAYRSCHAVERQRGGQGGTSSGGLVVVWGVLWALMWVGGIAANFVGQANPFVEGATAETVRMFWYAHMGSQALAAVTAAVAAVMVMKLTGVQGRLASMGAGGVLGDEPVLSRGGLPGMPVAGVEAERAPPLMPVAVAKKEETERPLSAPEPVSGSPGGLPGMPPPAPRNEGEVVRRAGLPGMPPAPVPAPVEEEPRQFMPGIPPPPGQSEAA
jgi:hypothetical protein